MCDMPELLTLCLILCFHKFVGLYFVAAECTDKNDFNTTYGGRFYSNCTQLASDPDAGGWLCIIYGGEGKECCSSCTKEQGTDGIKDLMERPSECSEQTFKLTLNEGGHLTCFDIATIPAYAYYCKDYKNYCCDSCSDVDTTCVDVPWKVTIRENEQINCSTMVNKYPVLCDIDLFGIECCKSCNRSDVSVGCYMNPLKYWMTFDDKKLYCEEYVTRNPAMCHEEEVLKECCSVCKEVGKCTDKIDFDVTLDNSNRVTSCTKLASYYPNYCSVDKYGGEGNLCCKSCEGIDASCLDSAIFFVAPNGDPISSCSKLANQYAYYCSNDFYGGEGNKCCVSCKDIDLTCVDDPNKFWQDSAGVPMFCTEAVSKNHMRCFSSGCCGSCKKLFDCSDKDYVTFNLPNEEISMKCSSMVQKYPYFCKLNEYSGNMGKCCASCQNTSIDCVDNPLFTVKKDNETLICDNVVGEMAYLCNEDSKIRENCCKTCPEIKLTTMAKLGHLSTESIHVTFSETLTLNNSQGVSTLNPSNFTPNMSRPNEHNDGTQVANSTGFLSANINQILSLMPVVVTFYHIILKQLHWK